MRWSNEKSKVENALRRKGEEMAESLSWRVNMRSLSNDKCKLPAPPGMEVKVKEDTELDTVNVSLQLEAEKSAKSKYAMNIAIAPGKALFQTAFMLWMSGSSIQIFSIYTLFNALTSPVKGILATEMVFSKLGGEKGIDTSTPKLIYVCMQLIALGVALYKCHTMGLLPLTSIDWLWMLPNRSRDEVGGIPI